MSSKQTTSGLTCFARLPKELRLQIWEDAQPDRILPFRVDAMRYGRRDPSPEEWPTICCRSPPLNLLAVNHESRQQTLKSYALIRHEFLVSHFYFNCFHDTLYIAEHWYESEPITLIQSVARCTKTHKVRSFAIWERYISPYRFPMLVKDIASFEEIFLIVGSEDNVLAVETLLPRDKPIEEPPGDHPDFARLYRRKCLVEAFESLKDTGYRLPRLTIVREDYWNANGLRMRRGC
ncbi:hypothetical protein G7Y89_g4430 [Cudoniella acicularis]|uniref:2EXR domain-containing protein n=1 Tax=Cudoniella acicularis TaxID=354080 RepID=A0A8H4RPH7_9HELO|nr:hypothetical protein G7Y89_g4430 [Cudoniella acicularis]